MIVSTDGDIIEALGNGVALNHLEKYRSTEYHLVKIDEIIASPADRAQVIAFARWCLDEPYDWLTIVSIILSWLTGCKFNFGFDGQCICSGLVARAAGALQFAHPAVHWLARRLLLQQELAADALAAGVAGGPGTPSR